jgi:ribose-phosphate pyrophosphokinase
MSVTLFVYTGTTTVLLPIKFWTFPGGERNCRIEEFVKSEARALTITCDYRSSDDLVDLILLTNTVRQIWANYPLYLDIPYFPFARQDRCMTFGEPNALQAVVQVINMLDFTQVSVLDPHSDVLLALFPPGKLRVQPQWGIWAAKIGLEPNSALVSPDAGAAKKIYKLAERLNLPVIEAAKVRDPKSGQITKTVIPSWDEFYDTLYVVDDICDGGRTFVELAKAIKSTGCTSELVLCVTHGIFSQGLEPLSCYDKIYCSNLMNDTINLKDFNDRNNP